jgi:hypothetical protein
VLQILFACLLLLVFVKMATLMMEVLHVAIVIILVLLVMDQRLLVLLVTPLYLENWLDLLVLVWRDGTIQAQIQFVKNAYINVRLVLMVFRVQNVLRTHLELLHQIAYVKKDILIMESLYVYRVLIIVSPVSGLLSASHAL